MQKIPQSIFLFKNSKPKQPEDPKELTKNLRTNKGNVKNL